MNELEFLRQQVATERRHMAAVASACASALAADDAATGEPGFLQACASYLVFSVGRFNDQDQAHCALLRPRLDPADAASAALLVDLESVLASNREAVARLAAARVARESGGANDASLAAALRDYLAFYARVLATRRHSIQHLFDRHYGIAEWRRASRVDADAILEERERYALVAERLPEGLSLAPTEVAPMTRHGSAASMAATTQGS